MRSMSRIVSGAALAGLLTVSAAQAQTPTEPGAAARLLGAWLCEMSAPRTRYFEQTSGVFAADGQFRGGGDVRYAEDGDLITIRFEAAGRWRVDGAVLYRRITQLKVVSATVNGAPMSEAQRLGIEREGRAEAELDIAQLTETELVLKEGVFTVTCARRRSGA